MLEAPLPRRTDQFRILPLQMLCWTRDRMIFLRPGCGLRVASVLRLHRLVTVTTALIRRDMGKLSPAWQDEVDQKLNVLFGLKG
jgi:hypothetical protein